MGKRNQLLENTWTNK